MIRPGKLLCAHLGKCIIRKGRPKSERMDSMREWMATWDRSIEEIIEIVDMHIPVAETPSRRNVEISNNLIDSDASLDTAPLLSLPVQKPKTERHKLLEPLHKYYNIPPFVHLGETLRRNNHHSSQEPSAKLDRQHAYEVSVNIMPHQIKNLTSSKTLYQSHGLPLLEVQV